MSAPLYLRDLSDLMQREQLAFWEENKEENAFEKALEAHKNGDDVTVGSLNSVPENTKSLNIKDFF